MRSGVFFLMLVLASGIAHAALFDPDTLGIVLGFTIAIVTALLAMTLLLSKTFQSPQLEAWGKTELRELLVAAVLFVIVNAIFFGTGNLVTLLTGEEDHVDIARGFIDGTQSTIEEAYRDSMRLFHYLTLRAGFWVYASTAEFFFAYLTFTGGQFSGTSVLFGPLQSAVQGLTTAWFEYSALGILLDFAEVAARVLLPVAFIFRFIPFTRKTGNTLIALALGAGIIFPFALVLVAQLHGLLGNALPVPDVPAGRFRVLDIADMIAPIAAVCSVQAVRLLLTLNETLFSLLTCLPLVWLPPAFAACAGPVPGQLPGVMPFVYLLSNLFFRVGVAGFFAGEGLLGMGGAHPSGWVSGQELTDLVYPFLTSVNNFVLLAYMDVLVIAVVTYAGIKSISGALGGEYLMPALGRLIR